MRKSIKLGALIVACIFSAGALQAAGKAAAPAPSGKAFHKGAFYLGGALGLGSGLGYLGGLAVIANAEYAVTDDIGIGGSVGYWSYSEEIKSTYVSGFSTATATTTYKYTIVPIIVSGAWHFHIPSAPKLDLAAGLSLGYYLVSTSISSDVAGYSGFAAGSASGVALGVFGLARYFVTDHIALRGKLGYGVTVVEVGVDFRF